ncbi:YggT family protein [Sphingomicrobium sp. XHP0239]|uniref:YggT family protein n=1 Tax=Sphingomicrobium maritimum TaxID=3133972 RepID=UPI0031CCC0E2
MILAIFQIISYALTILFWIIIAQVIISWLFVFRILDPYNRIVASIVEFLERVTHPIYRPIRKVLPDFGGIDLSPMVVIFAIIILRDMILPGILLEIGPTIRR